VDRCSLSWASGRGLLEVYWEYNNSLNVIIGDGVKVVFSSAQWCRELSGGWTRWKARDTQGREWEGIDQFNVIKPACMVENAVMHIVQVHQMLV